MYSPNGLNGWSNSWLLSLLFFFCYISKAHKFNWDLCACASVNYMLQYFHSRVFVMVVAVVCTLEFVINAKPQNNGPFNEVHMIDMYSMRCSRTASSPQAKINLCGTDNLCRADNYQQQHTHTQKGWSELTKPGNCCGRCVVNRRQYGHWYLQIDRFIMMNANEFERRKKKRRWIIASKQLIRK